MDLIRLQGSLRSRTLPVHMVTPVYIEVMAGATNREDLALFRAFLEPFSLLDNMEISRQDWEQTQRFAERIPRNGKPRQLGDCLIAAIAKRLKCEVISKDTGFPK